MSCRAFAILFLAGLVYSQTSSDSKTASPTAVVSNESAADALAPARALWKEGKYKEAAAEFKTAVDKNPTSADAQALLVRSLLRAHDLDEAEQAAKKAITAVPSSAVVHAAAGDVDFRLGKFGETETEYRTAMKLDGSSARAWFGMGRMYDMVSLRKQARFAFATAHQLDPDDGQIYEYWLDSLPPTQQLEEAKKRGESANSRQMKYLRAITQKKPWVLASELKPTEIKMFPYGREEGGGNDIRRDGPILHSKGYALRVKINDRVSAALLLDTGAGGITLGRNLAEKAGVVKIMDGFVGGIGDKGDVEGYLGWADKITIGGIEFHDCLVEVSSKTDVGEQSGLIGPNIFQKFLITLDFKNQSLLLSPLPKNPSASDDDDFAPDRFVAPEMQSFTKYYRFGHDLVVPVIVNDKVLGNFILDTGADFNSITPKLARQVTKAGYHGDYEITGLSGRVEKVLTGNKAILQFAKMRIASHDLPVFSIDNISDDEGTEIAGFIGILSLVQMKMTIDYRDGLVNLEVYEFKKAQE
jgi:Flp pilus assembly protein TadD